MTPTPRRSPGAAWADVQARIRFGAVRPTTLPAGAAVLSVSVREETPGSWSSLRVVVGDGGRRLRLKQFHYDWAVPLHAAHSNLVSLLRPFSCAGTIGWHGRDYKQADACCMSFGFTQVETSVEEGSFSTDEVEALYAGLVPVDAPAFDRWLRTPFAEASYHARVRSGPGGRDLIAAAEWVPGDGALGRGPGAVARLLPGWFVMDSSAAAPDGSSQLLARHLLNHTDTVWYRSAPAGGQARADGIEWLDSLGDHLQAAAVKVGDLDVYVGSESDLGGCAAVWLADTCLHQVVTRPSLHLGRNAFLSWIHSFAAASGMP